MKLLKTMLPLFVLFCGNVVAAETDVLAPQKLFQAYEEVCRAENGEIWGQSLCGPVLLADHETGKVYANRADADGKLTKEDDLWIGTFDAPNAPVRANTSSEWSGTFWAVIIWPPSGDDLQSALRLLTHESFHRIQTALSFTPKDQPFNAHMDEEQARLWLRLELRALAAALVADAGDAVEHFANALQFRAMRNQLFAGSGETERLLEYHEGLAEYTGWAVVPDQEKLQNLGQHILSREKAEQFARSFAYQTGPAYGLLLDQISPDWKAKLGQGVSYLDLGRQALADYDPSGASVNIEELAAAYGLQEIGEQEAVRAKLKKQQFSAYKARFVDGPRLVIPITQGVNMTFDPNQVTALGDYGQVYETITLTGPWGRLEATDGALLDWSNGIGAVDKVGAPVGQVWQTDGWRLELEAGWKFRYTEGDVAISREP